ncbi:MAG TPA: hypothetical protein VMH05_03690 [Bryobacteraceae bacterium]|nr:hypothetical protein [Bryobacteraceae bacterium]
MASNQTAFCLAEDRPDHETGLRLAILSLVKHCPGAPVYVYKPPAKSNFADWVRRFPQVVWLDHTPHHSHAWNCKPQALKPLLDKGHRAAVWLDADLVVTRDCRPIFDRLDEPVLAVTQEPASLAYQGTAVRTRAWKLEVGRAFPFTLNSSVVRVSRHHIALLERWAEMVNDPEYIACQKMALEERPIHMASDQDVLNALAGSRDFADIPLHVFRSAVDIIHAGGALGYSAGERIRGAFRPKPTFFHATAGKPWLWLGGQPYWSQRNFFSFHRRLLQETSPYLFEVRQYRAELGEDAPWMDWRTGTGMVLRFVGFGHFALSGLPIALAAGAMDTVQKLSRPARSSEPSEGAVPVFGRRQ